LITAVFNEDGKLINVEGDTKPAAGRLVVDKHQDTSVDVPGRERSGLIGVLKDAIPFTGDDDEEVAKAEDKSAVEDGDATDAEDETGLVASADSVTVPEGAPPKKKKGFFKRLVDAVGIGAEDDDDDDDKDEEPDDRKYRDPTDPDNL
jgi:hypothetical protein